MLHVARNCAAARASGVCLARSLGIEAAAAKTAEERLEKVRKAAHASEHLIQFILGYGAVASAA